MSDTSNPNVDELRQRPQRIRQIVQDCIRRLAEGEGVSDESLIEAHADLMPELADELRKLKVIDAAQRQASAKTLSASSKRRAFSSFQAEFWNSCQASKGWLRPARSGASRRAT